MAKDKRRKGCPNPACQNHARHVYQKPEQNFCPLCGTKLTCVCQSCFCELDEAAVQTICSSCEAAKQEKKDRNMARLTAAVSAVGGVTAGAAAAVKALKAGRPKREKKPKRA